MGFLGIFFPIIILGHSTGFNQKVILAKILDLEVKNTNMPSVSLVLTIFVSKNAFFRAYCKSQVKTLQSMDFQWFDLCKFNESYSIVTEE